MRKLLRNNEKIITQWTGKLLRGTIQRRFLKNAIMKLPSESFLILSYHGIRENKDSTSHYNHFFTNCTFDSFKKQIDFIRQYFRIVPLKTAVGALGKVSINKDTKPLVAITFDDGYKNLKDTAIPYLAGKDIPATFFITTGILERSFMPDFVKAEALFKDEESANKTIVHLRENKLIPSSKSKNPDEMARYILSMEDSVRKRVFKSLPDNSLLIEYVDSNYMSADDIREMVNPLFEIGSHSHSHGDFSLLPREKIFNELKISKNILEKLTGREIKSFAVPFGGRKYFRNINKIFLNELNYDICCSTIFGINTSNDTPLMLKRIVINEFDSWETLMLKFSGKINFLAS